MGYKWYFAIYFLHEMMKILYIKFDIKYAAKIRSLNRTLKLAQFIYSMVYSTIAWDYLPIRQIEKLIEFNQNHLL